MGELQTAYFSALSVRNGSVESAASPVLATNSCVVAEDAASFNEMAEGVGRVASIFYSFDPCHHVPYGGGHDVRRLPPARTCDEKFTVVKISSRLVSEPSRRPRR